MNKKNVVLIVIFLLIIISSCTYLFFKYRQQPTLATSSNNSYQKELSTCKALPNNSTQQVVDTSRLFINLPKDIYPHGDIITPDFSTVSGNATAGYVSNGGLPGYAIGAISGCWSTYIEIDGNGEVDLKVKSEIKDTPDYFVRFVVKTNVVDAGQSITYTNNQYGFTFALLNDWQGYTIVTSTWNGSGNEACPFNGCPPITGPEILIRNPQWTSENKWQPIPIMIFTPDQWTDVLNASLVVSAAPIPPTELGHNNNYVFALPARYDYGETEGWQEVDTIMQSNPLHTF